METLPLEMAEMIAQQLTPRDLARCSAVCREWREIFNQDWMWKPHCDPELEEPLRTTPCLATPAFVAPEVENSTLSPICCWKLAFLREKHLWKNWRSKEMMGKNKNITMLDKGLYDVNFLTDTLVVALYSNRIAIFDVSVVPTVFVAETDTLVSGTNFRVIGPTMLLLAEKKIIQVFSVDIFNKTIKLKHTISLISILPPRYNFIVVQEQFFLCLDDERSKLKIVALNTGKLLKEEPSPEKKTKNGKVSFVDIKISPTSDFVACQVVVQDDSNGKEYYKYYIYSLKQLAFLPGPVAKYVDRRNGFILRGHWLATTDYKTLKVYNFQTGDVLLRYESTNLLIYFPFEEYKIEAFNNCFVFIDEGSESCLKMYDASRQSLTTICKLPSVQMIRIINNKFIEVNHDRNRVSVWKLSGQAVEKSDINVTFGYEINRSFTKSFDRNSYLNGSFDINYLW